MNFEAIYYGTNTISAKGHTQEGSLGNLRAEMSKNPSLEKGELYDVIICAHGVSKCNNGRNQERGSLRL